MYSLRFLPFLFAVDACPSDQAGVKCISVKGILYLYHHCYRMGILQQIAEYLYLRKPDPSRPKTQWMKYMHGINRISILLFIFALIVLAIKLIIRK